MTRSTSLGVTSREHYLLAYEPNLKLDERRFIYGAAQFESDRFFGYDERYSLSLKLFEMSHRHPPTARLVQSAGRRLR